MLRKSRWIADSPWTLLWILIAVGGLVIGSRFAENGGNQTPLEVLEFPSSFKPEMLEALLGQSGKVALHSTTGVPLESDQLLRTSGGGRLIFAHVADGVLGPDRFMRTTFTLINSSVYPATGVLTFYDNDGAPLILTIGTQTHSSFPVSLASNESLKLATSGAGAVKSGWALLTTDQPVLGASSFSTQNQSGTVFSDVGVEESRLDTEFTLFADTVDSANTGVALVNSDSQNPAKLDLELFDAAAVLKSSKSIQLGPREHLARFLNELFQGTAGINEFRGSVRIRSDRPFAGITLRTVDSLLTSVPMVPPPDLRANRTRLVFPQMADGSEGGFRIATTVILFNNTTRPVSGTIGFVAPSGAPLPISVGSVQSAAYDFSLPPQGTFHLQTRGVGPIKTGWADVQMDGPIDGTVIYHIFDGSGRPLTEVGVRASQYSSQQSAIAESMGPYRTGLALASLSEDEEIEISLQLLDPDGSALATHEETLSPRQQKSLFLDEIFASVPGIEEFEGRVLMVGSDPYAGMTLRQAGLLTTSVPVLRHVNGFSPVSEIEPQQNLTGSSPALRWHFRQPALDLALNQLRISAPGLGLRPNQIEPGDVIGYGTFLFDYNGNSRGGIIQLIASGDGSTSGIFDAVIAMEGLGSGKVLFAGRLSGQSQNGFLLEIGPNDAPNCDFSVAGLEMDLILRDGLVQAPSQGGQFQVTTEARSASSKFEEAGVAIVQTTVQSLTFEVPAAGVPALTRVRPVLFSPGARLLLDGTNFGSNPEVFFTGATEAVAADFPELKGSSVEAFTPAGIVSGEVRAKSGATEGYPLLIRSIFNPLASLRKSGSGTITLTLDLDQGPGELGVQEFEMRVLGVGWPAARPDGEGKVGTLRIAGGSAISEETTYELRVQSSGSDSMVLSVREPGEDSDYATLQAAALENGGTSLRFILDSVPELPLVNGHPVEITLSLPGLQFNPPPQAELIWTIDVTSLASQLQGPETGIRADLGTQPLQ